MFITCVAVKIEQDQFVTFKMLALPWCLHENHPRHSPQGSKPVKKVRKRVPNEEITEERENIQEVLGNSSPPLQDNCVTNIIMVDGSQAKLWLLKGPAWPHQGQSPCNQIHNGWCRPP
jgi:hypothetical protein